MLNPFTLYLKDKRARREFRNLLVDKVIWRLKLALIFLFVKLGFPIFTIAKEGWANSTYSKDQLVMLGVNIPICLLGIFSPRFLKTNFFVNTVGVQIALWNCSFILWNTKRVAPLDVTSIPDTDPLMLNFNNYQVVSVIMSCQLIFSTDFLPNAIFYFVFFLFVEVYRIEIETFGEETADTKVLIVAIYTKLVYIAMAILFCHYCSYTTLAEMFLKNRSSEQQNVQLNEVLQKIDDGVVVASKSSDGEVEIQLANRMVNKIFDDKVSYAED